MSVASNGGQNGEGRKQGGEADPGQSPWFSERLAATAYDAAAAGENDGGSSLWLNGGYGRGQSRINVLV
jgi:hypothetical protein